MRSTPFRVLMIATLVAFVLILFPGPLLASEEGGGNGDEHASGGLAFTSIHRYDLTIYTLLVFFLLIAVLSKYAWPNIAKGLERREASIRTAQEEAKQDRINAAANLAEAKRKLDEAALQAKAMFDDARKEADAMKARDKEAAAKEIEARKQQAEREIAAYRDAQEKDLYYKAVQLATLMSEKALRREVSAADHSRLLDESVAELRAANKA
jgi:F-type H+-transporting ATPase subunit b